jgi:hypothetical protein
MIDNLFMFCCTTVGLCYKHIFFTDNKTFPIFIQTYKLYIRHNINTLSFLTSQKWRRNIEQCNFFPKVFPTEPQQSYLVNGRFPADFHNNSLMFILLTQTLKHNIAHKSPHFNFHFQLQVMGLLVFGYYECWVVLTFW